MDEFEALGLWLRRQPLYLPVAIAGESVYLRPADGGAELGAWLRSEADPARLRDALLQGFSSAREFAAGLGLGPEGRGLVLNRWLPGVRGWADVAAPLEELLDQLASWRAALLPEPVRAVPFHFGGERQEQRLRSLLARRTA